MIRLTLTDKTGDSQTHIFEGTDLTVGRLRHNDLVLAQTNVSKRHVKVVWKNNCFTVIDLRSTNGTYVNGQRITVPTTITSDDQISVGDFIIKVTLEQDPNQYEEETPPAPPKKKKSPQKLSDEDDIQDFSDENIPKTSNVMMEALLADHAKPKKEGVGSTMALGTLSEEERAAISAALDNSTAGKAPEAPQKQPKKAQADDEGESTRDLKRGSEQDDEKNTDSPFKQTSGLEGVDIGPDHELSGEESGNEINPEDASEQFTEEIAPLNRLLEEAESATADCRRQMLEARIQQNDEAIAEFKTLIEHRVATVLQSFEKAGTVPQDFVNDDFESELVDTMAGFGPIDRLLSKDSIQEVRVFGPNEIEYVEKGKLQTSDERFLGMKGFEYALQALYMAADRDEAEPETILQGTIDGNIRYFVAAEPLTTHAPTVVLSRLGYGGGHEPEPLETILKEKAGLGNEDVDTIVNALNEGRGMVVIGPCCVSRTEVLAAIASQAPESLASCSFEPPGTSLPSSSINTRFDRDALVTGGGLLGEVFASIHPDLVFVPELQYRELASADGLNAALLESGSMIASLDAKDGADFINRVDLSLALSYPGMTKESRSQIMGYMLSLVIQISGFEGDKKRSPGSVTELVIEKGDLSLNSISS